MLENWRTAAIDEKLRAMLAFLEKATLHPAELTPDDAAKLLAAGVSAEAARDALYVAYIFNINDRLADSMGWRQLSQEHHDRGAQFLLARGYQFE